MQLERISEGVVRLSHTVDKMSASTTSTMLVMSDQHFDSKQCDRKSLKKHLDQALEIDCPIIFLGDWFDAMQGRNDRRAAKSSIKASYLNSYFDDIVDETVEFLEPYAKNIAIWAWGNHESSVFKNNETRLITRAIELLRLRAGSTIYEMPYRGWILYRYLRPDGKTFCQALKIAYTHGDGGNAPVTRGAIKSARRAVMFPDADLFLSGHIHSQLEMPIPRFRISERGREYQDEQVHVQLPTYKTLSKHDGWEVEKGFGPPNAGGLWVDICLNGDASNARLYADIRRAR
jgi:predicted phosphodiesterase